VPGRSAPSYPGIADYTSAVFNAPVPAALRYDPTGLPPNFSGARPTVFDENVNVYGRARNPLDPSGNSTYALRPFDNGGVQYGLAALNAGAITVQQFLDLNDQIGGFDTDANQVMWRGGPADHLISPGSPLAIATFEQWMNNIAADIGTGSARDKVLRDKPAAAVDGCFDSANTFIAETQTLGVNDTRCNTLYPSYRNARMQAGGPLAWNVLKCQLKPLAISDYTVAFTAAEMARLQSIFPNGTCDFGKPGVNQGKVLPWPSLGPSPVNPLFDVSAPN